MGLTINGLKGRGSFAHGVHPPERKSFAADQAIEIPPPAQKVVIPLLQNVGAPCVPLVKPKQMGLSWYRKV